MTRFKDILNIFLMVIRNIWRDRKRSIFTMLGIGSGSLILLCVWGFLDWMSWGMTTLSINWEHGHLQIARPSFFEERYGDETSLTEKEIEHIEEYLINSSEIDYYNKRYITPCLLQSENYNKEGLAVFGMPEGEMFMLASFIEDGEALSFFPTNEIIMGEKLAGNLLVSQGDFLQLSLPLKKKTFTTEVELHNIYKNSMFDDKGMVYLNLDYLNSFSVEHQANDIIVFLKDRNRILEVENELMEWLASYPQLEVKNNKELSIYYQQLSSMLRGIERFVLGILILILFFNISNSTHMIIIDRQKEFATLRAIGTSRSEIVRNIFLELLFIGIIASAIGCALAYAIQSLLSTGLFALPPAPGQNEPTVVMLRLSIRQTISIGSLFSLFSGLSALIPAINASQKNIACALQNKG